MENISYFLICLLPHFNCLQVINFEFKSPDLEIVSPFHHQSQPRVGLDPAGGRDSSVTTQVMTQAWGNQCHAADTWTGHIVC